MEFGDRPLVAPVSWSLCISEYGLNDVLTTVTRLEALEWTSDYIKLYTWSRGSEPANIDSEKIDTSTWGLPSMHLQSNKCDINSAFLDQKLIMDIKFCGNPAGNQDEWEKIEGSSGISYREKTKASSCVDFVSKNPDAFKNVYFQVKDIRYFTSIAASLSRTQPHQSLYISSMLVLALPFLRLYWSHYFAATPAGSPGRAIREVRLF